MKLSESGRPHGERWNQTLTIASYSIKENGREQNFGAAAKQASFSLTTDESTDMSRVQKASQLKWDRKSKKFKREDATQPKMIRTESGALLPASMQSGRFKNWKSGQRRGRLDVSSIHSNRWWLMISRRRRSSRTVQTEQI